MKTKIALLSAPIIIFGFIATMQAQFSSGSDGSYGALNPTTSTIIQLPPNGVLNCTTVNIPANVSLSFAKNALNTPVYILATGDVTIAGYITLNGMNGQSTGLAGDGGPGGFAGGSGATAAGDGAGAGLGPGGGKAGTGTNVAGGAGAGSYGTAATSGGSNGTTYGSRLLIPLIGGSGGGGTTTQVNVGGYPQAYFGGGGGGGAILIASSTKIVFSGSNYIYAYGGSGVYNGGSGGAIRLVAPTISGSTTSTGLYVVGNNGGGSGRTRIDTLDHSNLNLPGIQSIGNVMVVFPSPLPKLSITNAAGTAIAEGAGNPVTVFLASGSSANQQITVRARDFGGPVPIRVALIPETGDPTYTDATVDNTTANPADGVVNITLPVNVQVHVEVYTR